MTLAVAATEHSPAALVTQVVAPSAALAPAPGGAKVTVTPGKGVSPDPLTRTASGAAKAVETVALCGVPAMAVTVVGTVAVVR